MSNGTASDFDEILSASERWMKGWRDQDRKVLEAVLAPDFSLVVASAPHFQFEREAWIDLATGPYRCTRSGYEHIQFHRLSNDIVAMSAIADQEAHLGREDRSGRVFVADIWRRTAAGWQVCARYAAPPASSDRPVTYMVGAEHE